MRVSFFSQNQSLVAIDSAGASVCVRKSDFSDFP